MNKFLGIVFALCAVMPVWALDNYVITSDTRVSVVENKTPGIISVKILTTLMNDRDTLVLESLKPGKGEFSVTLETGKVADFKCVISDSGSELTLPKGFEGFLLDDITKDYEIDLPPGLKFGEKSEDKWNK